MLCSEEIFEYGISLQREEDVDLDNNGWKIGSHKVCIAPLSCAKDILASEILCSVTTTTSTVITPTGPSVRTNGTEKAVPHAICRIADMSTSPARERLVGDSDG